MLNAKNYAKIGVVLFIYIYVFAKSTHKGDGVRFVLHCESD